MRFGAVIITLHRLPPGSSEMAYYVGPAQFVALFYSVCWPDLEKLRLIQRMAIALLQYRGRPAVYAVMVLA
jgi:hypothetical protein